VTARPGQESADLGGLLYAFRRAGAWLGLLCLTRGEASARNSTCQPLESVRPWELQVAASVLGISSVTVASYRDGGLRDYPVTELIERVQRAIRRHGPDLVLVIDPAADDRDGTAALTAACTAAEQAGVPAVARTWLAAPGAWMIDLGADAAAARAIQRSAAAAHASQSEGLPPVEHSVEQADGREYLRWLVARCQSGPEAPAPVTGRGQTSRGGSEAALLRSW
jgi:LmbE family N-acetylglucosaminyl deacetylase